MTACRSFVVVLFALAGCSDPALHHGQSEVTGTVSGLSLAAPDGVAIAYNDGTSFRIAPSTIACEVSDGADHLTFDLATTGPGTYVVVPGYPLRSNLVRNEARVHACPPASHTYALPCDQTAVSGTFVIDRYDLQLGGTITGSFDVQFKDGRVTGTFQAVHCADGALASDDYAHGS